MNLKCCDMKVIGKGAFIQMSAADRGLVDEIILALNTLGEEKKNDFL